jgi:hypothetical protein
MATQMEVVKMFNNFPFVERFLVHGPLSLMVDIIISLVYKISLVRKTSTQPINLNLTHIREETRNLHPCHLLLVTTALNHTSMFLAIRLIHTFMYTKFSFILNMYSFQLEFGVIYCNACAIGYETFDVPRINVNPLHIKGVNSTFHT